MLNLNRSLTLAQGEVRRDRLKEAQNSRLRAQLKDEKPGVQLHLMESVGDFLVALGLRLKGQRSALEMS